jgi:hypothetical protein
MFYIFVIVVIYFVFVLFTGLIGLLILNIAYARVLFNQGRDQTTLKYRDFFRGYITSKCTRLILLKIPLLLTVGIIILVICLGFFGGPTTTFQVRNKITESSRLVIRTGGNCHREPERERIMFETQDADVIKKFSKLISLGFTEPGRACMCCGEMTFDLYHDDDLYYSFSLHHRSHIRIKDSSYGDRDLSFCSKKKLNAWLEEIGITREKTQRLEKDKKQSFDQY